MFRWVSLIAAGSLGLILYGCPGFPRLEDYLEPNDTIETATQLMLGVPITARVVQGNTDVFTISAGPNETLAFALESLGEEDCAAFNVTGPDSVVLFADQHFFCGDRDFTSPFAVEGAELATETQGGYVLSVPADAAGDYYLTINELGEVDNFFDFSWSYHLAVTTTKLVE